MEELHYDGRGWCPICEEDVRFTARNPWLRDHLRCSGCERRYRGSLPRERALALALAMAVPGYRSMAIHELSPVWRGISLKLRQTCPGYSHSYCFPDRLAGTALPDGGVNQDVHSLTFEDRTFDLVVSLDVLEHVADPRRAITEIARTLKPRGRHVFTVPTYAGVIESEQRARITQDGRVEDLYPPEFHGDPISEQGTRVFSHFGYRFASDIARWAGGSVVVLRFADPRHGVLGEFTEVYVHTRDETGEPRA
jgi:SAM-dependent methyltransferase